jgi:hypothetical protein
MDDLLVDERESAACPAMDHSRKKVLSIQPAGPCHMNSLEPAVQRKRMEGSNPEAFCNEA